MNIIKPAIVIVAYDRTDSLRRLLNSIESAMYSVDDITLIISIDWSEKLNEVKALADGFCWNHGTKLVRSFESNQGLRKHVLACGDLSEKYGAVIVIEDDLVVAEDFYNYAYSAVNYYNGESNITGIALYSHCWNAHANLPFQPVKSVYDTYIAQFFVSWGQVWSYSHWKKFRDWYGKNQKLPRTSEIIPDVILGWPETSWGKYFAYYMASNNLYFVIPYNSMSTNYHEAGVHSKGASSTHHVPLQHGIKEYSFVPFNESVKYDIFFERIFENGLEDYSVKPEDLVVDLNGYRHIPSKKRYFLSSGEYDYPIIAKYGMKLRPIDENIVRQCEGNAIFLYDLANSDRNIGNKKHQISLPRARFELSGYSWRVLFPLAYRSFKRDLADYIERKLVRKKAHVKK